MSGVCVLPVPVPGRSYDVWIGDGLLDRLGELAAAVIPPTAVAVVTDETVGALYLERAARALRDAGFVVHAVTVPAGESSKSIAQCADVWARLGGAGIERGGAVVALGGGVVGDLAGFCAATWLRGVPVLQVPTTLLAMADAAIGGKTGVNLDSGKNLVGAFHQPLRVVSDVETLATLSRRDLASGLAEVVKCALLADREALGFLRDRAPDLLAAQPAALQMAVELAARTKVAIVVDDPLETAGRRVLLNLGHTVGHALETHCGHGVLRHGEAVAIGLVAEARVAVERGLASPPLLDEIVATLRALELPVDVPDGVDVDAIVALTRRDKKSAAGSRRVVVPLDAHPLARVVTVGDQALAAALH